MARVDRLLRQPPAHIDGMSLRAYRSLEQMAAKVSKEPIFPNAAQWMNGGFGSGGQEGRAKILPSLAACLAAKPVIGNTMR